MPCELNAGNVNVEDSRGLEVVVPLHNDLDLLKREFLINVKGDDDGTEPYPFLVRYDLRPRAASLGQQGEIEPCIDVLEVTVRMVGVHLLHQQPCHLVVF